jgi:mono/diheme cytochrome c family protein
MCVSIIRNRQFIALAGIFLATGCYKKAGVNAPASPRPDSVNVSNVTYANYIHAMLKNNCSTCHGKAGSAASFWYNPNLYENAAQFGIRIKETIVEGSMPPPPRSPFAQADKDLFEAWIKRGMPE